VPKTKNYISETHVCGLCHRKENTESFFFPCLSHAHAPAGPSASSVTMSTLQEQVQCVLWLAELQLLKAVQRRFRTQYERQPPTLKNIPFLEKHGPLKKMSVALERHADEVRANQFALLVCSYVQIPRSTVHYVLHTRLHLRP
jgi:hypothetical protein